MPIQGRRVEQKKPTISEKISAFFNGVGRKFKEVGGFIKQNPKKVVALSLCFIILAGFVVVEVVKNKNKDGQLDINQDVMTKQEQLIGEKDSIIGKKDEIIDELEQGVQDAEKERDEVAAENEVLAGRLSKEQSKTLVNVLFSENPEILKTMQMDTVEFDVREKEDGKATTVLKYTKENGTHVLYEIDMQIIDNADGLNQGEVLELGAGTYLLCSDLAGVSKTKYDRVVDKITDESVLDTIKTGLAGEFNIDGETINPDEVYYNLKTVEGKQVLSLNYDGKEIKTISPESRVRESKIGEYFTNRYVKQAENTIGR